MSDDDDDPHEDPAADARRAIREFLKRLAALVVADLRGPRPAEPAGPTATDVTDAPPE